METAFGLDRMPLLGTRWIGRETAEITCCTVATAIVTSM
jgi:hypothetical protein